MHCFCIFGKDAFWTFLAILTNKSKAMKVDANNIESLFEKSGDQKDTMIKIDQWITREFPDLNRYFFDGSSITMIGYGKMPWRSKAGAKIWPLVGLAPQKGTTNLYVGGDKDGRGFPDYYKARLGKVSVGKSCIRVRKTENLDFDGLKEMLKEAVAYMKDKERP